MMSNTKNFFRASAEDFKKIPGSPVAYWLSANMVNAFIHFPSVGKEMITREGMATSNNDLFLRLWYEVSLGRISFSTISNDMLLTKWVPYNKGGEFRKWSGNDYYVVNWENNGYDIKHSIDLNTGRIRSHNYNGAYGFKSGLTWSAISSGTFSVRKTSIGYLFDSKGAKGFVEDIDFYAGLLNSVVARRFLEVLAPTLDYKVGDIIEIPVAKHIKRDLLRKGARQCVRLSQFIWDSYETSWDFKVNPLVEKGCNLVNPVNPVKNLSDLYSELRKQWADNTTEMRQLETENNRIFIEAYGLQDELTPDVPWNEITLTCNPWYRYGVKIEGNSGQELGVGTEMPMDEVLESRLKSDTVKELISYAVGCMMGRYSLSKPGLILANQGSTIDDFRSQHQTLNSGLSTPNLNFSPDADGIIPILDDDSFADDIVTQFHRFLRAAFGERNFNENLNFIEDALGKDIRAYFVKDFYPEHLTRYQKRPIYWLFSSPKGTFSALVYMHRYNSGTVGQVLGYLRNHITKIEARVDAADRTTADAAATQGMKSRAIKERAKLVRQLKELEDYEREIMHPLASKRIEIDLDDGVKVNYPKFGEALRKIPGMKKEE